VKILALDSATASCSVAAWIDGVVAAAERADLPRGQAEALLPMAERVRAASAIPFTAFDRFAVTIGPGHFTGLRVGLAAARGLALAAGRPLVGITTLAAVAAAVPDDEMGAAVLVVALDSKRAEPYVQAFDRGRQAAAPPAARLVPDYARDLVQRHPAAAFLVAGDAGAAVAAELTACGAAVRRSRAAERPDAAIVAALAAAAPLPAAFPAPLYIHPVATTTAKTARRAPP
jgi:tRNA threonylcarbamoyladenosine biosynthesis protein TsaB